MCPIQNPDNDCPEFLCHDIYFVSGLFSAVRSALVTCVLIRKCFEHRLVIQKCWAACIVVKVESETVWSLDCLCKIFTYLLKVIVVVAVDQIELRQLLHHEQFNGRTCCSVWRHVDEQLVGYWLDLCAEWWRLLGQCNVCCTNEQCMFHCTLA